MRYQVKRVVALAGVEVDPEDAIIYATADSLVFWTYWDYQQDQLGITPVQLSIKLSDAPDPYVLRWFWPRMVFLWMIWVIFSGSMN
jgi:hypothetical protein